MKTAFASSAIVGLLFGASAIAADLPVKGPWPAPPVRVFTWTGCYLGGSAGGGFGHKESADPTAFVTGAPSVALVNSNPTGWVIGAQAGCDFQFSPGAVIGIEGTFSGGRIKGHSDIVPFGSPGDNATVSTRMDALATMTGRLGYAIDRSLVYAKAGFAWADERYSATGVFGGSPFDLEGPKTRFAWTVGAGLEWAFSDFWSVRLEYDFYDFGNHGVTFIDSDSGLAVGSVNIKQTVQTVELGLTFRFTTSPPPVAPIITKY